MKTCKQNFPLLHILMKWGSYGVASLKYKISKHVASMLVGEKTHMEKEMGSRTHSKWVVMICKHGSHDTHHYFGRNLTIRYLNSHLTKVAIC